MEAWLGFLERTYIPQRPNDTKSSLQLKDNWGYGRSARNLMVSSYNNVDDCFWLMKDQFTSDMSPGIYQSDSFVISTSGGRQPVDQFGHLVQYQA